MVKIWKVGLFGELGRAHRGSEIQLMSLRSYFYPSFCWLEFYNFRWCVWARRVRVATCWKSILIAFCTPKSWNYFVNFGELCILHRILLVIHRMALSIADMFWNLNNFILELIASSTWLANWVRRHVVRFSESYYKVLSNWLFILIASNACDFVL